MQLMSSEQMLGQTQPSFAINLGIHSVRYPQLKVDTDLNPNSRNEEGNTNLDQFQNTKIDRFGK